MDDNSSEEQLVTKVISQVDETSAIAEEVMIHETACVDLPCVIGARTKIWHFTHIVAGARIGADCILGQNVFVAGHVVIGNGVKIQNNVSLYDGCILEDNVFCGPSAVFTNIRHPRSAIVRKGEYQHTHVERGATIGANATIICGVRIGQHALIGAGAVVTHDVPPFALMVGSPARRSGWVGHSGYRLIPVENTPGSFACPDTEQRYFQTDENTLLPKSAGTEPSKETVEPIGMVDFQSQFRTVEFEVRQAIERVLKSQRFILGQEVAAFEHEITGYIGAGSAIGCASGSDALLLALMALDLKPGDEVLTSPYTFFATAGAIWRLGLKCVFCDIDLRTYNLDPAEVERNISTRSKAIIPVHLFGQCCEMQPLIDLSRQHGLAVIEDAAQALGSRTSDVAAGNSGLMGCFSFFPSKLLGGYGDGGMVVTSSTALAAKLRALRTHGATQRYYHEFIGINSRLDAIQAAVLRAKLPHLSAWAAGRRDRAIAYRRLFADTFPPGSCMMSSDVSTENPDRGTIVLPAELPQQHHVYNQYVIRVAECDRDALRAYLDERGIATEVYYPLPMHLQPCARSFGFQPGAYPNAERASRQTVALPMSPELRTRNQERLVDAVYAFCRDFH